MTDKDDAIEFIAHSPEIAFKMMERYERESCRLRDAIKRHQCRCSDKLETMSREMIDDELWAEVIRDGEAG